jgi:Protein phosphatase 2C
MLAEAPHPAPSLAVEAAREPRWRVAAASVRGAAHERAGQPCQDAHCWELLPGGILAAAVADGAGCARLAEVGASRAARAAVTAVRDAVLREELREYEEVWPSILAGALEAARTAVEDEAERRKVPPRELATTLIVLVAMPEAVAAAHVGDGAVVVADEAGNLVPLALPQNGEYANETTFLTSPAALERASVTLWRGSAARIAAFSDGLQRLSLRLPAGTPHAPFFSPLFRFIAETPDEAAAQAQLAAFLESGRVRARADDDLTLLLAALAG